MPNLGSVELERLVNQGEQVISDDINFLAGRYSLTVVAGTSDYTLPTYVRSIKRVTWKGYKLDPLPSRSKNEVFQSGTAQGRPYWYTYNNVGLNKISLFPVPSESVSAGTNIWSTDIPTSVIVEFWRISDNSTYVIPDYFRRLILGYYLTSRQYQQEGKRNRFNSAMYFKQRFAQEKRRFEDFLEEIQNRPVRRSLSGSGMVRNFPGRPILPIDRYEQ
jgi:hypothetical protein